METQFPRPLHLLPVLHPLLEEVLAVSLSKMCPLTLCALAL